MLVACGAAQPAACGEHQHIHTGCQHSLQQGLLCAPPVGPARQMWVRGVCGAGIVLCCRGGTTMEAMCRQIHHHLTKEFKYALVWGVSAKHSPQRVGLTHQLADEDVVQVGAAQETGWGGGWRRVGETAGGSSRRLSGDALATRIACQAVLGDPSQPMADAAAGSSVRP